MRRIHFHLLLTAASLMALTTAAAGQQQLLASPNLNATAGTPYFSMEERWQHYVRRTYSWQRLTLLGADSTVDLMLAPGRCGRGPDCWADRATAAFLRRTTRTTVELGAGALLKEDIRRRTSGETGLGRRLRFSLTHAFSAVGPEGNYKFAWSRVIGAAGGFTTWQAFQHRPITTGRMAHSVSWALASNLQDSLLAEFGPDMAKFGGRVKSRLFRRSSSAAASPIP